MLADLPGGVVGFLIVVNIFVFFLAFFLDFFEIAFIIVPLLAPVAAALGIDLIWFGVLLCVNMQTSFMHPPFGFALFYLRGIAPPLDQELGDLLGRAALAGAAVILVAVLIFWPEMVTYWLDAGPTVDPNSIQIEMPNLERFLGAADSGCQASRSAERKRAARSSRPSRIAVDCAMLLHAVRRREVKLS